MKAQLVRGPVTSETNITEFQKHIETKHGVKFGTYWDLHQWSIEHATEFWTEMWQFLKIIYSEPFTEVIEPGKKFEDIPKWFLNAKLNYTENILRHPDEEVALILSGEEWTSDEIVTFGQLRDEVSTLTSALRNSGIKKGDVITCYMSNRKEAIVALLSAASIGCLLSMANPLMGIKPVISRYEQLSPKVLLTIDRHLYNKEEKDILKTLPEMVEGLPTLEYVIIVPSNDASLKRNIGAVPKSIFYYDFLLKGLGTDGTVPKPHYEQLSFNHPLTINFTSGTTGQPKGVVHSAGAALMGPLKEMVLSMNARSTDVMFSVHATGWVSWNFFTMGLAAGSALVVYEGVPFYHYGSRFWDICDRYNVSFIFLAPATLEDLMKLNIVPGPQHKLKSLHTMACGSAFVKGYLFDFVHREIKRHAFFSVIYGSTEIMMLACALNHALPVYKEEIQVPLLGMDVRCYNEAGESVLDEKGDVIIGKPFPNMPLFFWNDHNMEKYRSTFFKTFPGVWRQGDVGAINSQTRGMIVYGRSDEIINQRGARFGSSEVYCIVNQMDKVVDSLCVGWVNKEGDEIGVLFVKLKEEVTLTAEVLLELRNAIAVEISDEYVPEIILQVKDIPHNTNGKKMEVLVKKILAKADNVSFDAVVNIDCLEEYINAAEQLQDM